MKYLLSEVWRPATPHLRLYWLIRKSFDKIRYCWDIYAEKYEERFLREIRDGLNIGVDDINNSVACDALIERATHQVNIRGMVYWKFV